MRSLKLCTAVVLMSVLNACGGGDSESVAPSAESSPTPAAESPSPTRTAPEPSVEPSDDVSPWQRGDDPPILVGTVGEPDEPEAFTISMTDSSGEPVKRIEPGAYLVRVTDPASYHNFHLTGPGVDKRTSVSGKSKVQWDLRLRPGRYTFVCDPHPQMVGNVVVTNDG